MTGVQVEPSIYQPITLTMNFIDSFEAELAGRMANESDDASLVRWASEQMLQSYKNGITAGRKGATVIRKGQSRRPVTQEPALSSKARITG